jgi:hypothetical protein
MTDLRLTDKREPLQAERLNLLADESIWTVIAM